MADVVPEGILSEPPAAFASLLSRVEPWQVACGIDPMGATPAADALEFINLTAWGQPNETLVRPLSIVSMPRNARFGRGAYGDGKLWWEVEVDTPVEFVRSHRNASLYFTNLLGSIIEAVMINQEAAGELFIRAITLDQPPQRCRPKEASSKEPTKRYDYFQSSQWVEYGVASP